MIDLSYHKSGADLKHRDCLRRPRCTRHPRRPRL
jgi:hypothetical protein